MEVCLSQKQLDILMYAINVMQSYVAMLLKVTILPTPRNLLIENC